MGGWRRNSALKREAENRLAQELGLEPGGIFCYPDKPAIFRLGSTGPTARRRVTAGAGGESGLIGLRIADELYRTARVLRLFTFDERQEVDAGALIDLAHLDAQALRVRLRDPKPLL